MHTCKFSVIIYIYLYYIFVLYTIYWLLYTMSYMCMLRPLTLPCPLIVYTLRPPVYIAGIFRIYHTNLFTNITPFYCIVCIYHIHMYTIYTQHSTYHTIPPHRILHSLVYATTPLYNPTL